MILNKLLFVGVIVLSMSACSDQPNRTKLLDKRKQRISMALSSDLPVLLLAENGHLTLESQREILSKQKLNSFLFSEHDGGKPYLSEVLSISPARPSDGIGSPSKNGQKPLRMELYNYAHNGTVVLMINPKNNSIQEMNYYPRMQGDLNEELANLARHIAILDPMVQKEFGGSLSEENALMHGTKTALNKTKCQRSNHLCAAPTFIKGDRAFWVIVDLTDLEVAGTQWTHVGNTGMPVTERSAQNDIMMREYCEKEHSYEALDWSIKFNMTRSDGLKVYDIKYKDIPLVKSIKTVDWHVSYSERKGFGYSDAIGCPEFSMAAVVAAEPPRFEPILNHENDTLGFALIQEYYSKAWPQPCAYNYRQEFEFYLDGSFRPKVASIGRGCGSDGTYRPVTRISFEGMGQEYLCANGNGWTPWSKEQWIKEDEAFPYQNENHLAKLETESHQLIVESNQGQFRDASRGDKAFLYVTVDHASKMEGESDLPTIGPCCNTDYRQGPEKFINGESLRNKDLVLWYVPELKNDGREGSEYCWAESVLVNGKYEAIVYPCFSGPKFNYIPKL